MKKQVIFTGRSKDKSYYSCSNPDDLVVGKVNNVVAIYDRLWQTDYILEGVEGKFDSLWFSPAPRTYIAIGKTTPVVGGTLRM